MSSDGATKQRVEGDLGKVERNPAFRAMARAGFAASGLIQLLVGVIAIEVALQRSSSEADQSGALGDLTKNPAGEVILWVAAIGALALALWLAVAGALRRGPDRKQAWSRRVRDWGKAVIYLVIGLAALRYALGGSGSSANSSRKGSATVLGLPGGPVLLGLIGLGVIALGVYLVQEGLRKKFVKTITVPSGTAGRVTVLLGEIGYAARGIAIAVVGILFVVAAFTLDPKKASGLDGALKAFAQLPFGRVVLVAIGIGWIASGVYSFIRAKQARLD
jgi:hypothetical protein